MLKLKIIKKQNRGQIIIYKAKDGKISLDVKLQQETVWLTQAQITKLFNRDQSVISRHIKAVFKEGELEEKSNMHFLHNANSDKPVAYYNLDVIISVGYRVKSKEGTRFRVWATGVLKNHLIQGYTLNEQRLKQQKEKFKSLQYAVRLLKIS